MEGGEVTTCYCSMPEEIEALLAGGASLDRLLLIDRRLRHWALDCATGGCQYERDFTPELAAAVERVAPLEFWVRALGAVLRWDGYDTDLSGLYLGWSQLEGAIFDRAELEHTGFQCCNLEGASFRDSNLAGASFSEAYLVDADFGGALLGDANFRKATLRGANLKGADLDKWTSFHRADLEGAIRPENDIPGWAADDAGRLHKKETA